MRKTCTGIIVGVAVAVFLSALAAAQGNAQSNAARSPWKYYPEDARANVGDGGPAPKRDLTGTWAGESSGAGVATRPSRESATADAVSEAVVRPEPGGRRWWDHDCRVERSSCPILRSVWFSRNMNDQIRSMTITTLPNRTFVLLKFMNIWREIWTDGRALPTNFGRGGRPRSDIQRLLGRSLGGRLYLRGRDNRDGPGDLGHRERLSPQRRCA